MILTNQPSSNSHHSPRYGGEIEVQWQGQNPILMCVLALGKRIFVCDDTNIFWRVCRIIDFHVGNKYIFIGQRFSECCRSIKNY